MSFTLTDFSPERFIENGQGTILASIFGEVGHSEKVSEIKQPLLTLGKLQSSAEQHSLPSLVGV